MELYEENKWYPWSNAYCPLTDGTEAVVQWIEEGETQQAIFRPISTAPWDKVVAFNVIKNVVEPPLEIWGFRHNSGGWDFFVDEQECQDEAVALGREMTITKFVEAK